MSGARPGWSSSPARWPPDGRRSRRPVLSVGAGLAVFTLMGVLIGLVIWRDPAPVDEAAAGTGSRASTVPAGPAGALNPASREARVGEATMRLPDDPYAVQADPLERVGTIEEFFLASAVVHEHYDGRRDWSAMVGLGAIASPVEPGADLEPLGRAVVRQLARQFFGDHDTQVRELSAADHAVDGRPGLELTAQVHYAAKGLPSRYDAVTVLLIRQDDGSVVAAFSSVPNDAPRAVARLAEKSLGSLRLG